MTTKTKDALIYPSFPRKRESILLIPMDSRFRGNDDNFVARMKRSGIRGYRWQIRSLFPDSAALHPGYKDCIYKGYFYRGCING
jgi:hypothetical protein